jgi:hypothetical protein
MLAPPRRGGVEILNRQARIEWASEVFAYRPSGGYATDQQRQHEGSVRSGVNGLGPQPHGLRAKFVYGHITFAKRSPEAGHFDIWRYKPESAGEQEWLMGGNDGRSGPLSQQVILQGQHQ